MEYGQNIRIARERQELTQKEMARILGIKQPQYHRYETNTLIPTKYLIKLAQTLQVSTDYLLGLTDDPKERWVKK